MSNLIEVSIMEGRPCIRSAFENVIETLLEEGVLASYSHDILSRLLTNYLKNDLIEISKDDLPEKLTKTSYGNILTIELKTTRSIKEDKEVKRILDLCGYYISIENKSDNIFTYQIEPLHPVDVTTLVKKHYTTAYHISPSSNRKKIQKLGLLTKKSETTFDHPPSRIYFVVGPLHIVYALRYALASSKAQYFNDPSLDEESLDIFTINPRKLPNKFYIDDTATKIAPNGEFDFLSFFTTTPIPPSQIKLIN